MTVSAKREAQVNIKTMYDGSGVKEGRRKLAQFEREQARAAKQAARDAEKARKQALNAGRGVLGAVGSGIGMAAGLGAAGGIAGIATEVLDVEKALTRLQITGEKNDAWTAIFRAQMMRVSAATGQSREALITGARAYTELTGAADEAQGAMQLFAEIANGSGASMDTIAQTAAALRDNLHIAPASFRQAFDIIVKQGHLGAVEIADLAQHAAGLAPMFEHFGGTSLSKLSEMTAAAQVLRKNFGDAAEMATGFRDMMSGFTTHAKKLKANNINVFEIDPKTKEKVMRNFSAIIKDIKNSKLAKDPQLMHDVFSDIRGYRAIDAMMSKYDQYLSLQTESLNSDQVAKDNAIWMESSAGRLETGWNRIKLAVAEAFTPERIELFVNAIDGLADKSEGIAKTLGLVGDILGGLYGVGRAISGAVWRDKQNPFTADSDQAQRDESVINAWGDLDPSELDDNKRHRLAAARLHRTQAGAYDRARDDIMAGEVNERSTPASIQRAIINAYTLDSAPGAAGAQMAGNKYLQAAGVSPEKAQEIYAKAFAEAVKDTFIPDLVRAISTAVRGGTTTVKVGSEPIVRAAKNSPLLNTRPGGRV